MSTNSKKIAIVTPFPPHGIGGGETFVKALYDEASKKNEVEIITIDEAAHGWQGTPILKSVRLLFMLLKELYRHDDFEIYHAQGFIALLACIIRTGILSKKKKIFVTILALYDFENMRAGILSAISFCLNRADKIFVEGETGRADILPLVKDTEKIIPFYHWVDLENFSWKIRPSGNKLVVLFVGRPIWIKGKHIVEQLERQLFKYEDIFFKYIENVPYDRLVHEYQTADIVIVPSQYFEGFPRVIFEAAACGCIIMASNRGALPELVSPFGYIENFKNEILKYYYDKKLCESNGLLKESLRTRCYAERFFSPKNAQVFLKEYEDA